MENLTVIGVIWRSWTINNERNKPIRIWV